VLHHKTKVDFNFPKNKSYFVQTNKTILSYKIPKKLFKKQVI